MEKTVLFILALGMPRTLNKSSILLISLRGGTSRVVFTPKLHRHTCPLEAKTGQLFFRSYYCFEQSKQAKTSDIIFTVAKKKRPQAKKSPRIIYLKDWNLIRLGAVFQGQ